MLNSNWITELSSTRSIKFKPNSFEHTCNILVLRPWPLRHRNATFLSFTFRSNLLGLWKVKGQVKVSTKAIFPSYWELIQQSLCEMTVHIVYFCPNNPHVFQVHIIFNPQALNSCVSCGTYHNRCLGNKKYER